MDSGLLDIITYADLGLDVLLMIVLTARGRVILVNTAIGPPPLCEVVDRVFPVEVGCPVFLANLRLSSLMPHQRRPKTLVPYGMG